VKARPKASATIESSSHRIGKVSFCLAAMSAVRSGSSGEITTSEAPRAAMSA
jgi:hypothetical protein